MGTNWFNKTKFFGKMQVKDMLFPNKSTNPVIHENMSSEEEAAFISSVEDKLASVGGQAKSPSDVLRCIRTFTETTGDVMKFMEIQKTKRVQIRANTDVAIGQIEVIRDTIQTYLEKTFDERRYLFEREFQLVDKAIESGNTVLLEQSLASITSLAKESPFKGLADIAKAQKELGNQNTIIDM